MQEMCELQVLQTVKQKGINKDPMSNSGFHTQVHTVVHAHTPYTRGRRKNILANPRTQAPLGSDTGFGRGRKKRIIKS